MSPSPSSDGTRPPPRLLTVPGLRGSGPAHWQTWLEQQFPGAARVEQPDWEFADIERWSERVAEGLAALGDGPHVVVAHSFGCLAVLHAAQHHGLPALGRLLLVAPAEPRRFAAAHLLPQARLDHECCVVGSDTDPWMSATSARAWALRWGADWVNLGDAGHINTASGFGPFPLARDWTFAALRHLAPPLEASGFDEHVWRVAS